MAGSLNLGQDGVVGEKWTDLLSNYSSRIFFVISMVIFTLTDLFLFMCLFLF